MLRAIQRFAVLGELGRGGMGVVVRAMDPRLDREVAIKLIELAGEPPAVLTPNATIDLRQRPSIQDDVLAEARMMARLSHPNVLPIYEVGLDGDHVFLVMEYIAGTDLRRWLEGTRSRAEILDVLGQAARGLAAAHDRGIVHRDFKPENVLVGTDGRARVADFGLANLVIGTSGAAPDTRGTPRYMAPELFADRPSTSASDVYALCVTITEAFGGETVPAALRPLLAAGLADDPQQRPPVAALIAELREPVERRPRRRGYVLAAGLAAVAGAAALVVARSAGPGDACDDDRVLDGLWDRSTRDALTRRAPAPLLAAIDDRATEILTLRRSVCEARQRGELGETDAAQRASCLERRAVELGIDLRRDTAKLDDSVFDAARPASCGDLSAPQIRIDRARLLALWERLLDPSSGDLVALERDARADGEIELALRAEIALGQAQRERDQLAEADATYERAYAEAVAIGSTQYQAVILTRRSALATLLARPVAAESYSKLALALVDRPTLHPTTRVRVYAMLATSALERGQPAQALAYVRTARDSIAKSGHAMDAIESSLRLTQIAATLDIDGATPATIALARESVAWAHARLGEQGDYPFFLTNLATALGDAGDTAGALPFWQRAVELFTKRYGADAQSTIRARMWLGWDLVQLRRLDDGYHELVAALHDCERSESARRHHPQLLRFVGQAAFQLGRFDEAIPLMQRAVDEFTSQLGADHVSTIYARGDLISRLPQIGKLDEAEHQLAAVEEASKHTKVMIAAYLIGVHRPQLLRLRGRLAAAEQRARAALAEADESKWPDTARADVLWSLGTTLADQKRWSDARPVFEQALAILERIHAAPDDLADVQVALAEVLLHLGERARAAELVTAAKPALNGSPSHVIARRQLAELAARLH